MEQVVITVEALRCHRCRQLIHPSEPFFQHQMMTAVSVGRHDTTHTYTLEDVCEGCHVALTQAAEGVQRRAWWRMFWLCAFVVNAFFAAIYPINIYPFYAALAVRVGWKWWAKRWIIPNQTAQQVPQTMAPSAAEERTTSNTSS